MDGLSQVQPGYYGSLQRYPFHNPVKGALLGRRGRGCNVLTGWFVVDGLTWNGASLATLDLRFEQHCEGAVPALHGKVHWDAADTTLPRAGAPDPAAAWTPAAGSTPASGNYIHLDSQAGDYIGQGQVATITDLAAFSGTGRVSITGGGWTGTVPRPWTASRSCNRATTQPEPLPFPQPRAWRPGMERQWPRLQRAARLVRGGQRRLRRGWMAAIDLRFEQHCDGASPACGRKVHWVR
jgi:hypothetical protein